MKLDVDPGHSGRRLDRFLQEKLPDFSRSRIQSWIREGRVLLNGETARPAALLRGTEIVEVAPADPPPLRAFAEDLPLEILHEDDDVVVVNKPAGMVVHIGAGNRTGTLVNALLHHFGTLSSVAGETRPGIVHRLDRYTSGVMLVARTDAAHRALAAQFAARQVEKFYVALVHGDIRGERGRVDKPIARDPLRRLRMTAKLATGRKALTEYRVLERLSGFTFLEVRIMTGRMHQIRVHMSSIGHPVAGDALYGAPSRIPGRRPLERLFLHSHRLGFQSPSTGRPIVVECPLPCDLEDWMAELKLPGGSPPEL
ncbi:MAG: RluA family pseudouridine synthase [Bryobacteraceae bacterium]|nr:RluA family pseudouridine synthase [Bryobacteraceae bacterium]